MEDSLEDCIVYVQKKVYELTTNQGKKNDESEIYSESKDVQNKDSDHIAPGVESNMEQTSAALNDNAATNISNNNIVSDDNPSESEESVESIDKDSSHLNKGA